MISLGLCNVQCIMFVVQCFRYMTPEDWISATIQSVVTETAPVEGDEVRDCCAV